MTDSLPPIILQNTYAVSDLYRRADLLQRFLEHIFFEEGAPKGDRVELIRAYYRESDAETQSHATAIAAWGTDVLDSFTSDTLYERIRTLKYAVRDVPKLTLYVPVHLPPVQVARIGVWCRAHLQQRILLDLRSDPSAVGGCAFAYNNAFHDVSLTYFSRKAHGALVEMIRNYEK